VIYNTTAGRGVCYDTMLVGLLRDVTRGTRGFPTIQRLGEGFAY
jgi:hypothetical protein